MTAFEEKFPSLKNEKIRSEFNCQNCALEYGDGQTDLDAYLDSDVEKFCLDKNLVKEVLRKYLVHNVKPYGEVPMSEYCDILTELELE